MKDNILKYEVVLANNWSWCSSLFVIFFLSKQEDYEGIGNVVAFFLPFLACVFQVG